MNPAILFEPDGYMLDGPKLMGRQAAGDGFLRAAVKAHGGKPLIAYTPSQRSAEVFRRRVTELDPTVAAQWLPAHRLDILGDVGLLYRPDHALGESAATRLRVGAGRYSLCGVTHTLCSARAMEAATELATLPVMPWDAVICTSTVGREVIVRLLDRQADYLAWRFGKKVEAPRPQLPVIPLGVHAEDFASSPDARAAARTALGLAEGEVAALFAGRLSFNAKAHPYPMYAALQEVAKATGRRIVLLHAGQFHNAAIEEIFRTAAAQVCPDVRCLYLDGKDAEAYGRGWRAADLFVSLSDNIQETFGITPLEAMASGLPVLVTDWDGYKDTVRDGVDGFRIPTWQPAPGLGENHARLFETGTMNYDYFLHRCSMATTLDMRRLVSRLTELVTQPELRRRMGQAGQMRVRETFEWTVVYRRYQELWAELGRIRAADAPAWPQGPAEAAHKADPFDLFSHYPSAWIEGATPVRPALGASAERYQALTGLAFLGTWKSPPEQIEALLAAAAAPGATVADLADAIGRPLAEVAELAGRLAKMELLHLGAP